MQYVLVTVQLDSPILSKLTQRKSVRPIEGLVCVAWFWLIFVAFHALTYPSFYAVYRDRIPLSNVRRVLYMATIVAIRHNSTINAFYIRLKSKGKESKVAIVACMRKLVTILNLLVKSNQTWQTK